MDWHTQRAIKACTTAMQAHVHVQGGQTTGSRKVQAIPYFRKFFLLFFLIGTAISAVTFLFSKSLLVAGIFFGTFSVLPLIGLISYYNCWILYDDQGFTVSNFWGWKHHYLYRDIQSGSCLSGGVVLSLHSGKCVSTDSGSENTLDFFETVLRHCGENLPPAEFFAAGMDHFQLKESYESGVLNHAMILPEEQLPALERFKRIAKAITYTDFACVIWIFLQKGFGFLPAVISFLLSLFSVALYFFFPDYYTAREIPEDNIVPQALKKYHKHCPMAYTSLCTFLLCFKLWLNLNPGLMLVRLGRSSLKALAASAFLMLILLFFCRYRSREYRKHHLGLVSFGLWAFLLSLSAWILFWGFLQFPMGILPF